MRPLKRAEVGYYTEAGQTEPQYDPGLEAFCPICDRQLSADDVRTYSLMPMDEHPRVSCFYRVHRTCAVDSSEATIEALDAQALDWAGSVIA